MIIKTNLSFLKKSILNRYIVCIICVLNNFIVVFGQNNKKQEIYVQTLDNNKNLFSCNLQFEESLLSNKLTNPLKNETFLGYQYFTKPKVLKIAILATGEYSQYFLKKNKANHLSEVKKKKIVLNAIEKTLYNANKILKRDLGVVLELVDNNERLIFLDPKTDQLTGNNAHILIHELTSKINSIIDIESYNLGHVFFNAVGGLSFVGGAFGNRKAQAVTGGIIPEGKIFDIDFFTHEIGHQLGATHTQNSDCIRNTKSSVEPGSGSTIMGYAGVCKIPKSNVKLTSETYFHDYNILQVKRFLNKKDKIFNKTVSYGLDKILDYTIPKGTAFEVFLKGSFPSNSKILYSCNQIDKEFSSYPPTKNQIYGPVFSAQKLSVNSIKYFPEKDIVINGNHNSIRGVVSEVARKYKFLASARAEKNNRFLTSHRMFNVNVVDIPAFEMNSQDKDQLTWIPNTEELITWKVGETKKQLKVDYVDILLSDNNGKSFDYVLAEKTKNDGKQLITVPNTIISNNCRIKIKACNSIFYTLNTKRFSITPFHEIKLNKNVDLEFNKEISSSIFIENDIVYKDIEVGVSLSYSDVSKLNIELQAPNGNKVKLWDHFCSKGTNFDIKFKDDEFKIPRGEFKSSEVCDSILLGFRAPAEALRKLNSSANGDWNLKIINNQDSNNFGQLKNWSLHFVVKGKEEDSLERKIRDNIILYPNPVQNNLRVQFKEINSRDVKVELFSVEGILKETRLLSINNGNELDVKYLSSGVYFLRFHYNNEIISKKIIKN